MSRRRTAVLFIGLFALCLGYFTIRHAGEVRANGAGQASPDGMPNALHPLVQSPEGLRRLDGKPSPPEASTNDERRTPRVSTPSATDPLPAVGILSGCVEASLSGHIDAFAIVDAVLSISDSDIDPDGIVEFEAAGNKYPLMSRPAGVSMVEFMVKSARACTAGTHGAAVRVRLSTPAQLPFIEGALREAPEVEVCLTFDAKDEPIQVTVLTTQQASAKNLSFGIPLDQLKVTSGVLYAVNLDNPSIWTTRQHGMDHMSGKVWEGSVTREGTPWPNAINEVAPSSPARAHAREVPSVSGA